MQTLIITVASEHEDDARRELRRSVGDLDVPRLGTGVLAVAVEDAVESALVVAGDAPVFIRHQVAATHHRPLSGTIEARTAAIVALALEATEDSDLRSAPVGVQIRVLDGTTESPARSQLWAALAPRVADLFELSPRHPEVILSVIVTDDAAWAGFNATALNLSPWAGGARHFSHGDSDISRAGFKLEEAIEAFGLAFKPGQRAADLGAAPGGWTAVLARHGLIVDAVDPARLDRRVLALKGVTHHRCRTDRYAATTAPSSLDLIVNDMRIDASEAAELLVAMAPTLKPGATVLTTLKLPKRGFVPAMDAALGRLSGAFAVSAVRHLFHNRSEVTALLSRR